MKRKLLFINQKQFGYHINYAQYCKYLKTDYDITYLCWDYSRNKIIEDNIEIIYVSRHGNIFQRNIRFIGAGIKIISGQNFYQVFINYFRGCSIIPIFINKNQRIHLNIVTGSVSTNSITRYLYNTILRFESKFFNNISTISEGLKRNLRLSNNTHIFPLGAVSMMINRQKSTRMHLLYIGTLSERRLEDTVVGLSMFIKMNPEIDIQYTIIGNGWGGEMELILNKIKKHGLNRYVELLGYIPHNNLKQYFEKANIGITYIPITPWYEYQPATKTYEYLMAGMPVIATDTYENRKIINKQNGIIIDDTPESFAEGLFQLQENILEYDGSFIKNSVNEYEWKNIINQIKDTIMN